MSTEAAIDIDREKGNFSYDTKYEYDAGIGLNEKVVNYIADVKGEDDWVRAFRLKALDVFNSKPLPTNWATKDLENIDFDKTRVKTLVFVRGKRV